MRIITNSDWYDMKITDELDSGKDQTCMVTKLFERKCISELLAGSRTAKLYADISGPMKVGSYEGSIYFPTMTIAHGCYKSDHLLAHEEHLGRYFHKYISCTKQITNVVVFRLQNDKAVEYIALSSRVVIMGSVLTSLSAHLPQSLVEHINRSLLDQLRKMPLYGL